MKSEAINERMAQRLRVLASLVETGHASVFRWTRIDGRLEGTTFDFHVVVPSTEEANAAIPKNDWVPPHAGGLT